MKPRSLRHTVPNYLELDPEILEERARVNPYIREIYNYEDWVSPHPNPQRFQEDIWYEQGLEKKIVHVEIGCGSGRYLAELSQRYPQQYFIGFEIRYKRLVLAAKKLKANQSYNALLLRERGEMLSDYFPPESIDALHVNFPDPWPKKAHRKHRLLSEAFFIELLPLLKPKAVFFFKTDHQEYFQSIHTLLQHLPQYTFLESTNDLTNSPYQENNIPTEFEMLFRHKGNPPIGYLKTMVE